jgi:acetyltransferase-like isoleucine patch superfamily enzyme
MHTMFEVLLRDLRAFWLERRRQVHARFQRSLPLADYVVDRWEKARELGFGEGTSIYDSVLVLGDVVVGRDTWIGPFVVLDGSGGLQIGSHCSISAGVQVYTHDTVEWAVSGGKASAERAPTRIGDNCYVGPNTVIAKGVTIGNGCAIGANSLVLRDIPAGSKAFGTPCRVVGSARRMPSNLGGLKGPNLNSQQFATAKPQPQDRR